MEQQEEKIRLPRKEENEMFAVVIQMLGADRLKAFCEDKKERVCRIPGKLKKRVWIREGDIIIIKPWDFQPEKADVIFRYHPVQIENMKRKGIKIDLPNLEDII